MGIPFLTPSRTVLLITDEALQIYATGVSGAKLVDTLPWDAENFENDAAQVIAKDCKRRPVVILHDMVEQYYRKERVPKVGVLDKKNVMARKLLVTFPSYPVRGSLELKEKLQKSESSLAANIYIFAAIAESEQLTKTLGAIKKSLASIVSFSMLPVEAADMVSSLAKKAIGKQAVPAEWTVFMGQHKSGGLRQIVIKNGELALTRMTPMIDSDMDADHWAQDMHTEFKSTLSYLLRFGYSPSDPLDVIAIANPSAGEILQNSFDENVRIKTLTSHQAALHLGMKIEKQVDGRYADPLHVSWTGGKSKFILPMQSDALNKVSKPRKIASLSVLLLIAALAYQGFTSFSQYTAMQDKQNDYDLSVQRVSQLQAQYDREVERKEALGFDVRLLQSSIAVYEKLLAEDINVLQLADKIGKALDPEMSLDSFDVKMLEQQQTDEFLYDDTATAQPLYEATLQMSFPNTTDVDDGNESVRLLRSRLQRSLPDHDVEVTKLLKDYAFEDALVVETGDNVELPDQEFTASLKIKKRASVDGDEVIQ